MIFFYTPYYFEIDGLDGGGQGGKSFQDTFRNVLRKF